MKLTPAAYIDWMVKNAGRKVSPAELASFADIANRVANGETCGHYSVGDPVIAKCKDGLIHITRAPKPKLPGHDFVAFDEVKP